MGCPKCKEPVEVIELEPRGRVDDDCADLRCWAGEREDPERWQYGHEGKCDLCGKPYNYRLGQTMGFCLVCRTRMEDRRTRSDVWKTTAHLRSFAARLDLYRARCVQLSVSEYPEPWK